MCPVLKNETCFPDLTHTEIMCKHTQSYGKPLYYGRKAAAMVVK